MAIGQKIFVSLADKIKNMRPLYVKIAGIMADSVEQNFQTEGKRLPGGWPQLAKSTIRAKTKKGYSMILQNRGTLASSIQASADNDAAYVGTNLKYARIQQLGGEIFHAPRSSIYTQNRFKRGAKKGKFKKGTNAGQGFSYKGFTQKIPARPFLKLNDDDNAKINDAVIRYLTGK
jgi:phage virion morphogenesis protein